MSAQSRAVGDDRSMLDDAVAIDALTPEEAWAVFDRAARHDLHMSGKEFLRRWDDGALRADPDQPVVASTCDASRRGQAGRTGHAPRA